MVSLSLFIHAKASYGSSEQLSSVLQGEERFQYRPLGKKFGQVSYQKRVCGQL